MDKKKFWADGNWSGTSVKRMLDVSWNRVRRFLIAIPCVILPMVLFAPIPARAQIPSGSYTESCQNIALNGATLVAKCKNSRGQWVPASLSSFKLCIGDIANDNGSLRCSTGAALPVGSYTQSCRGIYINGNVVSASCKNDGGQWVTTSLPNVSQCLWGLANNNGALTCSPPPGSYAQSCRNMHLSGNTLLGACNNGSGQWVSASLSSVNQCINGDITNDAGALRCSTGGTEPPPGSYTRSCQSIYMDGATLYASCKNDSGQWVSASLPNVSQCLWGAGNSNGTLRCAEPPGSYQQTCQNVQLNGAMLTARCKNMQGQGIPQSLNISQCMPQLSFGGDIFNQKGSLLCTSSAAVMNFSNIASARTPAQADSLFSARNNIVVNYDACHYGGNTGVVLEGELYKHELSFTSIAIAKLEMGGTTICQNEAANNLTQVSNMLMNSRLHDDWQLGTSFPVPKCGRTGELDVAARGLITILYRYQAMLPPSVYNHVLHDILAPKVSGPPPTEQWYSFSVCGVNIPETENHILNSQTSRYLTNQLLGINNETNRFNEWMLQRLQVLLENDFTEYNARPYQLYSMMALQNLVDFARDPRVKLGAQMVLDFESAKFAVSSSGLRRAVPFRRREEYLGDTGLMNGNSDPQTYRFMMLSGMTHPPELAPLPYSGVYGQDDALAAAVTSYRIPDMILDIILNKERYTYYQRIRGSESPVAQPRPAGVELYSGAAPFLITAGGYWQVSAHSDQIGDELNCDSDTGWPLPTTLMPAAEKVEYGMYQALDYTNFIRIDGDRTVDTFGLKPEAVAGGAALGAALGTAFFSPLGGKVAGEVTGAVGGLIGGNKIECKVPERHRKNTCVAPGFACGLNPIVPTSYQRSCRSDQMDPNGGHWTFIDASENSQCPRKGSPRLQCGREFRIF
jgi:hypothetical protein